MRRRRHRRRPGGCGGPRSSRRGSDDACRRTGRQGQQRQHGNSGAPDGAAGLPVSGSPPGRPSLALPAAAHVASPLAPVRQHDVLRGAGVPRPGGDAQWLSPPEPSGPVLPSAWRRACAPASGDLPVASVTAQRARPDHRCTNEPDWRSPDFHTSTHGNHPRLHDFHPRTDGNDPRVDDFRGCTATGHARASDFHRPCME